VRILRPPIVHVLPEIIEQGFRRSEYIWDFVLAHVLVIALACFIVVAQYTAAIHHEGESITKAVVAS
jgi:hypothetical protein